MKPGGLILHLEIIEQGFVVILCSKAGISQILLDVGPLLQASVVEHFKIVSYDKRHDTICQTLLEHYEPTHTTITILEWVNGLEALMKVENIIKGILFNGVILGK